MSLKLKTFLKSFARAKISLSSITKRRSESSSELDNNKISSQHRLGYGEFADEKLSALTYFPASASDIEELLPLSPDEIDSELSGQAYGSHFITDCHTSDNEIHACEEKNNQERSQASARRAGNLTYHDLLIKRRGSFFATNDSQVSRFRAKHVLMMPTISEETRSIPLLSPDELLGILVDSSDEESKDDLG